MTRESFVERAWNLLLDEVREEFPHLTPAGTRRLLAEIMMHFALRADVVVYPIVRVRGDEDDEGE